jgi:hypothetical protein
MSAGQTDGDPKDLSDEDNNKDNRYFLFKIDEKNKVGERQEDGLPLKFFDDKDQTVLHSTNLLQDLNSSEFKYGVPGSVNETVQSFLNQGTLSIQGANSNFPEKSLTWNVDSEDPRNTEVNWATASKGFFKESVQITLSTDTTMSFPHGVVYGNRFIQAVSQGLELSISPTNADLSGDDTWFDSIIDGSLSFVLLPGQMDTIFFNRLLEHEANVSPGALYQIINDLISPTRSISNAEYLQNKGLNSFEGIAEGFDNFTLALESRLGKLVSNRVDGNIYTNKNDPSKVYYSDSRYGELFPDTENEDDYDIVPNEISVFDEFRKAVFDGQELSPSQTVASGIMYNHSLITGQKFINLVDTPTGHNSGYYMISSETGIDYISSTGLADDILSSATGLADGYLKIKSDGTGIEFTTIENIEGGVSTFTGLKDTPTGYENGKILAFDNFNDQITGVELKLNTTVYGLGDVPAVDSSEEGATKYLQYKTLQKDAHYQFTWIDPTGLAADIGINVGATGFTGLHDTPTNYESGYYLRSTETGIEYVDITGLSKDVLEEIGDNVGATGFTGLHDTPTNYESGYYLRSTETGIEYVDITGLSEEVRKEIGDNIGVTGFTGLHDTPTNYESGYYLRSTETGIEYVDITGLSEEVRKEIGDNIGVTGFTGLHDTPTNYESGYYLRSTETGIEYVDITGLSEEVRKEIGDNIGVTGFTGLHDTPTGYKEYADRYFIVSSGNALNYEQIKFLENVKDAPNINSVPSEGTGYLQVFKKDDEWTLKWAPGTVEGDITQNFQGTEYFTGLEDTPTNYESGYYLRSTETGIEYVDITGLSEEVRKEIGDNIGVTGFTGLHDTPTNYESGYYLRSTETGIEYVDITGLSEEVRKEIGDNIGVTGFTGLHDTPTNYESGYYLRSTETGIEYVDITGLSEEVRKEIGDNIGVTGFTGLHDTPTNYESGYYLRSTETGIEYVDITGLSEEVRKEIGDNIGVTGFTGLHDTPTNYESGYYLRSTETGIEYVDITGLSKDVLEEIGDNVGATGFTGLHDTPTNYESGYYLRSTETGIEYVDITGLSEEVRKEIGDNIGVTGFTGLHDTPTNYESGYYLRSTETGIEYVDITGLSEEVRKEIGDNIGVTGFTGLHDTPTNYESGYYLRSTETGIEYVDITGLSEEVRKEIGDNIGVTGFTGLHDTPTGYKEYADRYFIVSSGNALNYEQIKFLENVKDAPNINSVPSEGTGYLQVFKKDDEWTLKWAPGTVEGDITQNFQGTEYFTGLEDTPTNYESGYYLRSTETGIEYVDITGLSEEVRKEIGDNIGVTGFTGLHDTPTNYENGYYLRSTETGIEYVDITGLSEEVRKEIGDNIGVTGFTGLHDTPTNYESGYYLRSTETGIEYVDITGLSEEVRKEIGDNIGVTGFTGLHDTPTNYESGYYLRSTETGIEYVDITGLSEEVRKEIGDNIGVTGFTGLHDTPTNYESGYYLRSTETGIEYVDITGLSEEVRKEIGDNIGVTGFTGLHDTPTNYESGYYLRSTETGIEYVDITGLSEEVRKEIGDNIGVTGFTGLHDTPTNYESGYYLRSTETGIEYVDITGLSKDVLEEIGDSVGVTGFTGLHDTPTNYESGYYLRSTKTGIEYVDITGLSKDVLEEIGDSVGVTGFTGLHDTPTNYESGYYLRSTETGIEYVDITGLSKDVLEEIGDSVGVTGFTGLHDTPTNYESGYYLRSTKTGIEYVDITGLSKDVLEEIGDSVGATTFTGLYDTPEGYGHEDEQDFSFVVGKSKKDNALDKGIHFVRPRELSRPAFKNAYLQLDENLRLKWAAGTTEADVTYNFTGTEYFTGLLDTPDRYPEDKAFLQANKNQTLTYSTYREVATGIAVELNDGQLLSFTGLKDTPTGYSGDYFLKSTEDSIEYISLEDITKTISTEMNDEGLLTFTGLKDTPTGYSGDYFLKSTEDSIEYISLEDITKTISAEMNDEGLLTFTGLQDTPTGYSGDYFLKSTEDSIEYISLEDITKTISTEMNDEGLLTFTGLQDTPTGYSGDYFLKSTEDSIEYISLEDITKTISTEMNDEGLLTFTGLQDTPTGYKSGQFLRATEDSIEYVDPTGIQVFPSQYISESILPENVVDNEIVSVGCNLYIGCEGKWQPVNNPNNVTVNTSEYPQCVKTVQDLFNYQSYIDDVSSEIAKNNFIRGLNGENHEEYYSICLDVYSSDFEHIQNFDGNTVVYTEESSYPWGMFKDNSTINIHAKSTNAQCSFEHWTGAQDINIGNKFEATTTVEMNQDVGLTAVFDCSNNIDAPIQNDLLAVNSVRVSQDNFILNGVELKDDNFSAGQGSFLFKNVPEAHPIAFIYNNNESIRYGGSNWWSTETKEDKEINYYWGDVILEIDSTDSINLIYKSNNKDIQYSFDQSNSVAEFNKFQFTVDYSKFTLDYFTDADKAIMNNVLELLNSMVIGNKTGRQEFVFTLVDSMGIKVEEGGVLAAAGGRDFLVNSEKNYYMPSRGDFWVDPEDIARLRTQQTSDGKSLLYVTLLHECIHALGFGTSAMNVIWNNEFYNLLVEITKEKGGQYIGYNGVRGYNYYLDTNFDSLLMNTMITLNNPDTPGRVGESMPVVVEHTITEAEISTGFITYENPWSSRGGDNLILFFNPDGFQSGDKVSFTVYYYWNAHTAGFNPDEDIIENGNIQPINTDLVMNPFAPEAGGESFFSPVTFGILADLGWTLDFSKADKKV